MREACPADRSVVRGFRGRASSPDLGRIAAIPGIVMVAPPQLSLFAFHLTWPGATLADEYTATTELMERVTQRGRVMITGCMVDGRVLARVCVLRFRTRQDRIDACVEDVEAEAAAHAHAH